MHKYTKTQMQGGPGPHEAVNASKIIFCDAKTSLATKHPACLSLAVSDFQFKLKNILANKF